MEWREVEESSHEVTVPGYFGAKILRLVSLAQDDLAARFWSPPTSPGEGEVGNEVPKIQLRPRISSFGKQDSITIQIML